jgi:hypothetical protein
LGISSRNTDIGRACSIYEYRRSAYRILVGKPEERRPLEKFRRIILKWILEKWDGGMDWFDVAQERDRCCALVNWVNEPSGSIQCGNFLSR